MANLPERGALARKIVDGCSEGSDVLGALAQSTDWEAASAEIKKLARTGKW